MPGPSLEHRLHQSQNVTHITCPVMPRIATTRNGREVILTRDAPVTLKRRRETFALLQDLDLSPLDTHVSNWSELQSVGIDVVEHYLTSQQSMTTKQFHDILRAAISGVSTIGSFLHVVPEVLDTEVNQDQTRKIARQSLRTMMEWARFSNNAEADLTHILTGTPLPKSVPLCDETSLKPSRDKYVGAFFNPAYFAHDTASDTVVLNYEKLAEHTNKIDVQTRGTDIFYGCVYRQGIPHFYHAMLQTAIRSELL